MKHDTIANITAILLVLGGAAFLGGQFLSQSILSTAGIALLVLSAVVSVINLIGMRKTQQAQATAEVEEVQPTQEETTAP